MAIAGVLPDVSQAFAAIQGLRLLLCMGLFSRFLIQQSAGGVDENAVRPTQRLTNGEMVRACDRDEPAGRPGGHTRFSWKLIESSTSAGAISGRALPGLV
jgi:hypothetical protein